VEQPKAEQPKQETVAAIEPPAVATPKETPPAPPPAAAPAKPKPAPPTANEVWQDLDKNNVAGLQAFITRFPGTPAAELAAIRLEAIAWEQVSTTDAASLRGFLDRFPKGLHAEEATQRLQAIEGNAAARQAILASLQRYEGAYRDKNLNDVAALRPQLARSELDQIREFFRTARTVNLQLRPLNEPTMNGDQAVVNCARTLVFVDNVGTSHRTEDQVTIRLRRAGTLWIIAAFE
jgi:hypothetical protein